MSQNLEMTNLELLSKLQVWDKLYIVDESITAQVESWHYWQPITRTLWNWVYGGADRTKLLQFLETLYTRVEEKTIHCMAVLNKPYVKQNLNTYGILSDESKNCIDALQELGKILPLTVSGLQQLQKTYENDISTLEQLKEITAKYGQLSISVLSFLQRNSM